MSTTWLQALRAYVARTGASSTLASRHRLYDQIAQTHLAVRRGARLRPDSLAILREARWVLLRDGTVREKADLLEHILKSLSHASETVTYDGSTKSSSTMASNSKRNTIPSAAGHGQDDNRRGDARGCGRSSQRDPSRVEVGVPDAGSSSAPAQNLSERHQLLLEQIQCLVEAKVSGIPLSARHYRYPLRSPLLAEVSPELPLLLLDELGNHQRRVNEPQAGRRGDEGSPTHSSSGELAEMDWEARVDCCASLAGAGHLRDALTLCGADGRMFRAVLQRVARQRRDGWRQAWALAEAVPMERVVGIAQLQSSSSYSEDWLRGVLEAVHMRFRAASSQRMQPRSDGEAIQGKGNEETAPTHVYTGTNSDNEDDNEQLFAWVDQLRQLLMVPVDTKAEDRQARALRKAQRLVMDAYLSVCPPSRWREAIAVVLELKAAQRASSLSSLASVGSKHAAVTKTPEPQTTGAESIPISPEKAHAVKRNNDDDAVPVSAGRVMALLQLARQPWMTLLFFYGDPLELLAATEGGHKRGNENRKAARAWSVDSDVTQLTVTQLLRHARESNRLSVASGALLSERDVHHAAVYNHTMAALATTGHISEVMLFYQTIPVACVNAYTHWNALRAFLQPKSPLTAGPALESSANYQHCQRALKRLVRTLTSTTDTASDATRAKHINDDDGDNKNDNERNFTRDQANVWESMSLWAALRRDAETAQLCATHAPPSCRYVRLIAMVAAANEQNFVAVSLVVRRLCNSPRTTRKELCLAAALMAVYYPFLPPGSDHAQYSGASKMPELVNLYGDLTRGLGRSVGHQQSRLDETMQLLIDYVGSLQRRRSQPFTVEDKQQALQDVLVKPRILHSTMDLVRLGCQQEDTPTKQHQQQLGEQAADATAVWHTVVRVIQSIGSQQELSVARAAPALISAGAPAEVAIDLLPS